MQKVHLWIGQLDGTQHEHYFADRPPEDENGFMHNQFARDQGKLAIDYDFTEISFVDDRENVRTFVDGHSYSASYIDAVVAFAKERDIKQINAFVLANADEYSNPCSVSREGLRLEYVGVFDCID